MKNANKSFDRNAWLAEKREKADKAKALLAEGLASLQTSDDWKNALARIARSSRHRLRVSRYSFSNQLLLALQGCEDTMVGGFMQWKDAGRSVKKGAKSFFVIQPRPFSREVETKDGEKETRSGVAFSTAAVFGLSQTDGEAIPSPAALCETVSADAALPIAIERFRAMALALEGSPVSSIEFRTSRPGDPPGADGWYVIKSRAIVVLDTGNAPQMLSVLAHEVAHAILHGAGDHHETAIREVEAESTAFVVCSALGLDTSKASFPYVAVWAKGRDAAKTVLECGDRISRAANMMLDALYIEANDVAEAAE